MPAGRQWQLPLLLLFWWQLWTARAASNGFCLAPAYPFIPLSLSHSLSVSLSLVSFLFTWRDFYLLFTRNFVTAMTPALIGHALHTHTGTNTHRDKHTHTHFGTATNCETRALYAIWVKVLTKQQCSSTLALPLQLQLPLVRCATCPVPRAPCLAAVSRLAAAFRFRRALSLFFLAMLLRLQLCLHSGTGTERTSTRWRIFRLVAALHVFKYKQGRSVCTHTHTPYTLTHTQRGAHALF